MRAFRLMAPVTALLLGSTVFAQTVPPSTRPVNPPPVSPGAEGTTPPPVSAAAGGPANPFPNTLHQRADIARSLEFTDAQLSNLNSMTDRLQSRYQDRFNQLGRMSDTERAARAAELDRLYMSDWMAGARGVMNERQLTRFQQLQLQSGGFTAFNDPDIQRQLNLTDAQVRSLRQSIAWNEEQWRLIQERAAADRERGLQLYSDYYRAYQDRLSQWLTADQMRTWRQMTGDPFQFPPIPPPTSGTTPPANPGAATVPRR